ncbi:YIP1 family protein [Streptomycetaceae bacterium NBC_01309]
MTGNDRYPYGPQYGQPDQYDQYGRPQPRPQNPSPYAQQQPAPQPQQGQPQYGQSQQGHYAHPQQPQQQPQSPQGGQQQSAYPGGPLSLPDETSIYIYGEAPDGYTQVAPAVPPTAPRSAQSTVYRNGQPYDPNSAAAYAPYAAPPPPPRPLTWQELFGGLLTRPLSTLERARDQAFWWPALIVSAVCGVLAMVANDKARDEVVTSTLSTSVPAMLITAVVVPGFMVVLGWVSTMLAQMLGGNGDAGPLITLAAVVAWFTDAPRLAVSLFASDDNSAVMVVGVVSFALTAWLLTAVAMRVHELAWPRALGAVSVQLIALLLVLKLPLTSA